MGGLASATSYRRAMTDDLPEATWVPDACTLPTAEQPTRVAEFDELFRTALREQERLSPTRLRWVLDPDAEALARDLADRETSCCSFFRFAFPENKRAALVVEVDVPPGQTAVLDALAERATATAGR